MKQNSNHCIANIHLHTIFGADREEVAKIRLFVYFQDGGRLGPPTTFLDTICHNGITIRSDVTDIHVGLVTQYFK